MIPNETVGKGHHVVQRPRNAFRTVYQARTYIAIRGCNIGALKFTYTILVVPYYSYCIRGPTRLVLYCRVT